MNTKKNIGYTFNTIANTLTMTALFAKNAGKLNTPEYRIVKQLRADNPNITIEKRTGTGHTVSGIKFDAMMNYMRKCKNAEPYLKEYQMVKELSKGQPSPYRYVYNWFAAKFTNYSETPKFYEDEFTHQLYIDEIATVENGTAGVEVQQKRYPGMVHGFASWVGFLPGARDVLQDAAAFLKTHNAA